MRKFALADENNIRFSGRTNGDRNPFTMFWTGSGMEMKVKASELYLDMEADYVCYEPWICVVINGELISHFMLGKGRKEICIFRNMDAETVKNVKILKAVQPMPNDSFHNVRVYGGRTDGVFLPLEEKKLKLEFIGDSITSGEGLYGAKKENDWISMFFSCFYGYPYLVSEKLDALFQVYSQSGWGLLCSWDNNPNCALPDYYEKVCGVATGEKNRQDGADSLYDFNSFEPDFVVINLGTNDDAAFHQPEWKDPISGKKYKLRMKEDGSYNEEDVNKLKEKVKLFLSIIRYHNPEAVMIWAFGMLGKGIGTFIQDGIRAYKECTDDTKVFYISLPENTEETTGSRMHPGRKCHEMAADVIIKTIQEMTSTCKK